MSDGGDLMRLKTCNGGYASLYPQERPIAGARVKIFNDLGDVVGIGTSKETGQFGVVIITEGRIIDSNSAAHWAYA